mgnify:CR=1 FL=1
MDKTLTAKQALEAIEENVDNYYALCLDRYPFSKDPAFVREAYKLLLKATAGNWKPLNQELVRKTNEDFAKYYKATQISYRLVKEQKERRRNHVDIHKEWDSLVYSPLSPRVKK